MFPDTGNSFQLRPCGFVGTAATVLSHYKCLYSYLSDYKSDRTRRSYFNYMFITPETSISEMPITNTWISIYSHVDLGLFTRGFRLIDVWISILILSICFFKQGHAAQSHNLTISRFDDLTISQFDDLTISRFDNLTI